MFLVMTKEEMQAKSWYYLDYILVTGDAYVDHPSFGTAIIARVLEDAGYKVGIIAQPDWKNDDDFKKLGTPRYAFLVSSGNIDSMVNHYTVAKRRRQKDLYSPNEEIGLRPNRATTVYAQKLRSIYKDKVAIILGGIEASLRRLAHYDYWANKIMPSVLIESKADMLIYGMGERQVLEIAKELSSGKNISEVNNVNGTVWKSSDAKNSILLPSFEKILKNKRTYADSFLIQSQNTDAITAKAIAEYYNDEKIYLIQNPPAKPLNTQELDKVYDLNYTRSYHPIYEKYGGIKALEEVKWSIVSNRGCFGNCNFCALSFHQGRTVSARSHESILKEAEIIINDKDFKGYIHDLGGPTANFRYPSCKKQLKHGVCKNKECLFPTKCNHLYVDHSDYLNILIKLRNLPKVKKVFVRSGIRYDYLMYDNNDDFFYELSKHHISGQLKVAPEHISKNVLDCMGKPGADVYKSFYKKFYEINKKVNKKQFIVPYLMSSHPASKLEDAIELAEYLNEIRYSPEQVQDFYPTPGTMSTCIYYTKYDPVNKKDVYVADNPYEKSMQRALLQYRNPKNYNLVYTALMKAKRNDLIGFSRECLIPPRRIQKKSKKY